MENRVTNIMVVFCALIVVIGIVLVLFYKGNITGFPVVEGDVSSIAASGITELGVIVNNALLDAGMNYSGTLLL